MNRLYYGDCLTIMRDMPPESVDLIYLDPPFNSNRDYSAIYKDETGRPLPDQLEAFSDSWALDAVRERAIRTMPVLMREAGVDDDMAEFWRAWPNALRKTQPGLLAYLSYMAERLLPMRGLLKPTGSIYLHCDDEVVHYMKVVMDSIFGRTNFRNHISWQRIKGAGKRSQYAIRNYGHSSDMILFYSAGTTYTFNAGSIAILYDNIEKSFPLMDGKGRYKRRSPFRPPGLGPRPNLCYEYKGVFPPHPSGWTVKRSKLVELDDAGEIEWAGQKPWRKQRPSSGIVPNNIWADINTPSRSERLGYATQKPLALLDRIIRASSNEGDLVLDPFCGCATTLEAAHRLNRRWVGIDIAIHAIKRVAKVRLQDRLGLTEGTDFTIEGVPHSLEGARDLWQRDPYHFQKWAVEQVDGFVTARRTGDGGIDGRLYFDTGAAHLAGMVLEVKGGANIGIGVVRDLRGVLEREDVPMAGLIVLEELGERKERNFRREMAQAGDLDVGGILYPRMQMLTVQDILVGRRFQTPSIARARGEGQPNLPLG
ncbi:MAG: modification methylase EcaI [Rhodobacteraceae bacterium]|nr:modification methylase EcaI [Paracoccaceae bacterium]